MAPERSTAAAIAVLLSNDMHEHPGQASACARMNEIVPPWSRPG